MLLHNKIDKNILKQQIARSTEERKVYSFYKYFLVPDAKTYRNKLYLDFSEIGVLGRIYVASEGVNAQVSVPTKRLSDFFNYIKNDTNLNTCFLNEARKHDKNSFWVLKVKVRNKIVADGLKKEIDFTLSGKHLSAKEFNSICQFSNTVIVDMRNHYEYEVGHIKNAITTQSDTFREQLEDTVTMLKEKKDSSVVMYCTGGIRCEKASAYLKSHGVKNVFQLGGGVIHYHKQVEEQGIENLFVGKNFVFDQRLGEDITNDIISTCHQCGKPCNTHVNCQNSACHLLFIQCDECAEKMLGCCTDACQAFISQPIDVQRVKRKGLKMGRNIFNKSKKKLLTTFPKINNYSKNNITYEL